jgi:hypothetical protein
MTVSPLHTAVREQLLGCINSECAAPAIFLLAHDAFDAGALRTAALIYSEAAVGGAQRLAQCLREEARVRASGAVATPAVVTSEVALRMRDEDLAALLIDLSARIGLCARIDGGSFNDGVRAAQKEVEAAIRRLPISPSPVSA